LRDLTSSTQRPNIVFVFAHQLRYQLVGYVGDPNAHTPNLDRLATESVNFAHAVISMTVCAAARSSLWTGKDDHHRHVWGDLWGR
jgi:arylsulfatase A-like enzyme